MRGSRFRLKSAAIAAVLSSVGLIWPAVVAPPASADTYGIVVTGRTCDVVTADVLLNGLPVDTVNSDLTILGVGTGIFQIAFGSNGSFAGFIVGMQASQPGGTYGWQLAPDFDLTSPYATGSLSIPSAPSSCSGSSTLSVKTSVSNFAFAPDPGSNGYVLLTVTATNGDGTPASNAAVTVSNAPTATFHTNSNGTLNLEEPVNITASLSPNVSASVTATTGATASATQQLYSASIQVSCSFAGRPTVDLTLLDAMLPTSFGNIQTLIESFGATLSGIHTQANGYDIAVPEGNDLYAQTVLITNRQGAPMYNGVGYGSHQILQPSSGLLQSIQKGCSGPSA